MEEISKLCWQLFFGDCKNLEVGFKFPSPRFEKRVHCLKLC